jgi:transposase-like protein
MKTNATPPNYKGFRFPPEIVSHAVWLYFRFSLSFRDFEELLVLSELKQPLGRAVTLLVC